ncbi:MAG: hypothetical protein QGH83_08245, partial [Candidatus Pacebacteria bacterium]|nr:hypothetical protein [Candidatus Paceibacterota bacterium]
NSDSFINSFEDNNVYLMIGKKEEWASTGAGQYAGSGFSDTSIPTPIDTTQAPYIHHNDMIAAKLIGKSDVSHVLKRVNWTSGTVYEEYDHLTNDIIGEDFFVFTSAYRVYKCISNYGGAASIHEPDDESTDIIETPDKYRWKFMYQVPVADILKFVTTDWIPMKYLEDNDGSAQWDVQQAAVDGALEHIDVTAGGTSYIDNAGTAQAGSSTTITLESGASTVDDTYNTMSVYITSGTGNGQLRAITDYNGTTKVATVATWTTNPDTTSVYEVMPSVSITTLEGSSATARVSSIIAGVIKKVSMVTVGTGYRSGTAVITGGAGSGCTLEPRFSPPGGHGKNVVSELGGAFVMMNSRLIGADGSGDFPVGNDFRKVILIVNPTASNVLASASTYYGPQWGDPTPVGEGLGELDEDSGEIIYVEYRAPINRVADQTEDIKIVAEF